MTARLQAATTSGKPILLRVDYEAGHGIGSTKNASGTGIGRRVEFSILAVWGCSIPDVCERSALNDPR
jgi:protease II